MTSPTRQSPIPGGGSLGPYQLQQPLGSGGMGDVYLAQDTRLGRQVAIKLLHDRFALDPDHRGRLLTEARAASSLRSSSIAAIYDIGEQDGAAYIVMEFVEGEPLSARIERGAIAPNAAVDIASQVADALDEAHTRGIIHRDIKSANLMVDSRGRVKVLDFGLAKFVRGGALESEIEDFSVTRTNRTTLGMVVGTFAYMSPEQALGRTLDFRTDLFSLGVVMYEMLAGHLPFEGATITEVLDRIINHQPAPLPLPHDSTSNVLIAIVERALTKDPDQRYQSARELYIDLQAVIRAFEAAEPKPTLQMNQMFQLAAGLREPRSNASAETSAPKTLAVTTFANITREPADDWIGAGIAETLTADLQNVSGLSVISRAQVFEALRTLGGGNSREADDRLALQIGRRLHARWVVVGAYQRVGDALRITAQLMDVSEGTLLRTVKVDGRTQDIFGLQDKIVLELSTGLNVTLGDSDIAAIGRVETKSIDAYEAYAQGMTHLRQASRESIDHALLLFEKATKLDSQYAAAWVSLGRTYSLKGFFLGQPDIVLRGVESLTKAISLAPEASTAHAYLGFAYTNLGRHAEAIEAIHEAIRLDPEDAESHAALGRAYWIGQGRFDAAIIELEEAVRLYPEAGYTFLQLALLYTLRGRYERAEWAARRAIEMQEESRSGTVGLLFVGAYMRLGYVYYRLGRYDEAIHEYEKELTFLKTADHALRDRTEIEATAKLAAAYSRKGDRARADRHLDRAEVAFERLAATGANDGATQYYLAAMHALWGHTDRAQELLSRSIQLLGISMVRRAQIDPDFEPVLQHSGVAQLLGDVVSS